MDLYERGRRRSASYRAKGKKPVNLRRKGFVGVQRPIDDEEMRRERRSCRFMTWDAYLGMGIDGGSRSIHVSWSQK